MLVKLFYTCMCFLCNSPFKSSLELMLCVIDISTLNKTYLIWFERWHKPQDKFNIGVFCKMLTELYLSENKNMCHMIHFSKIWYLYCIFVALLHLKPNTCIVLRHKVNGSRNASFENDKNSKLYSCSSKKYFLNSKGFV